MRKIAFAGTRRPHPWWRRSALNLTYLVARAGYLVGTTHAGGADQWFGEGPTVPGAVRKFLPVKGHRQESLLASQRKFVAYGPCYEQTVREVHPKPEAVDDFGMKLMKATVAAVDGAEALIVLPDVHRGYGESEFAMRLARRSRVPIINLARGEGIHHLIRLCGKLPELEAQDLTCEVYWLHRAAGLWDRATWLDRMASGLNVLAELAEETVDLLFSEAVSRVPHSVLWEVRGFPYRRSEPRITEVVYRGRSYGWRVEGGAVDAWRWPLPQREAILAPLEALIDDPIRLRTINERWSRRYFKVADAAETGESPKAAVEANWETALALEAQQVESVRAPDEEADPEERDPDYLWKVLYVRNLDGVMAPGTAWHHDTGSPVDDQRRHLEDLTEYSPGLALLARECEAKESGLVMQEVMNDGGEEPLDRSIERIAREFLGRQTWEPGEREQFRRNERDRLLELRDVIEALDLPLRGQLQLLQEIVGQLWRRWPRDPDERMAVFNAVIGDWRGQLRELWLELEEAVQPRPPAEPQPNWDLLRDQIRERLDVPADWVRKEDFQVLARRYGFPQDPWADAERKLEEAKELWATWMKETATTGTDEKVEAEGGDPGFTDDELVGTCAAVLAAKPTTSDEEPDEDSELALQVSGYEERAPDRPRWVRMFDGSSTTHLFQAPSPQALRIRRLEERVLPVTRWMVVGRWRGEAASLGNSQVDELFDAILGARTTDELEVVRKAVDDYRGPMLFERAVEAAFERRMGFLVAGVLPWSRVRRPSRASRATSAGVLQSDDGGVAVLSERGGSRQTSLENW